METSKTTIPGPASAEPLPVDEATHWVSDPTGAISVSMA